MHEAAPDGYEAGSDEGGLALFPSIATKGVKAMLQLIKDFGVRRTTDGFEGFIEPVGPSTERRVVVQFDWASEAWSWVDRERERLEHRGFRHAYELGVVL